MKPQTITTATIMTLAIGQTITKGTTSGKIVDIATPPHIANDTGKARALVSVHTDMGMARIQLDADHTVATIS
jgi:hypothetical protein